MPRNDQYHRVGSLDAAQHTSDNVVTTTPSPRVKGQRRSSREGLQPGHDDDDDDELVALASGSTSPLRKNPSGERSLHSTSNHSARSLTSRSQSPHNTTSNNNAATAGSNSLFASASFDLEGDSDEGEDDLFTKRYHLDFSREPSIEERIGGSKQRGAVVYWFRYAWYSLQSERQQARQRRAQRLLSSNSQQPLESLWISLQTACDATDLGIGLLIAFVLLWLAGLWWTTESAVTVFLAGLAVLTLRLGARPAYRYALRQRSLYRWRRGGSFNNYNNNGSGTTPTMAHRDPPSPGLYFDNSTDDDDEHHLRLEPTGRMAYSDNHNSTTMGRPTFDSEGNLISPSGTVSSPNSTVVATV